jgi:hypothetical protein
LSSCTSQKGDRTDHPRLGVSGPGKLKGTTYSITGPTGTFGTKLDHNWSGPDSDLPVTWTQRGSATPTTGGGRHWQYHDHQAYVFKLRHNLKLELSRTRLIIAKESHLPESSAFKFKFKSSGLRSEHFCQSRP